MDRPSCPVCGRTGEVREFYDDVQIFNPCECRGGPPTRPNTVPVGPAATDAIRRREIFEALVAEPTDVHRYRIRMQIALAMATADEHRHFRGVPQLLESGMILDDCH